MTRAPSGDDTPGAAGPREGPVVTIDGPAGSGKSTTAREAARRLGFRHLDSGALYRALTWALLESGLEPARWPALSGEDLRGLGLDVAPTDDGFEIRVGGRVLADELRSERVTAYVSQLARIPAVRGCLLDVQRGAGAAGRLVADGRDMGTVVFPDADLKVFLVADLEERAVSPLRKPDDAWELDTTGLDFEAQVEAVVRRVRELTTP